MAMAGMGGIERAAQQPDAARDGMADAEPAALASPGAGWGGSTAQGRTWPLPRTTYL
jgi:hypothetical protein